MTAETIAVVGAGVVGCMTAREILDRSPESSVTILDRDTVGSGASRRSAGLHFPRGASERVRKMSAESEDRYAEMAPALPDGVLYPVAAVMITAPEREPALREVYLERARLTRAGEEAVVLPEVSVPAGDAVFTLAGCHYSDVYAFSQHLVATMRPRASVREGVRVLGVESRDGAVVIRLGTGELLRFDRAVLAPGPWIGDPAWRELVAPLGLRVKKIVAMHVDREPAPGDPVVVFPDEDAFLLPLRHRGHFLFSYTCQEWDLDPDGPVAGLSDENVAEARACLARYAPSLAAGRQAGRVFYDAYSPDREPRVEPLDAEGRIVFAGAGNGSGYRLAPAIAVEAAQIACPATPPDIADPRSPR